jgi:hypothetical protein
LLIAASWPALVRIPTASATREMAFCDPLRPTPTPKVRFDDTDYSVVVRNWGGSSNQKQFILFR